MELELLHTGILSVNTFIVHLVDNFVFIVDPAGSKFSYDEQKLVDYLQEKNLVPIAVFLTHGHFDHIMGVSLLKNKWPEIKIAIHQDDADCIGSNSKEMQKKFLYSMGPAALELLPAFYSFAEPDIILQDGITFDKYFTSISKNILDEFAKWKVIHTPGHTKGSVCFYNSQDKKLISGDTIFYGTCGRTDLFGGSEVEIFNSIKKVLKLIPGDTLVYPGHDYTGFELKTLENLF